jgi:hypothetical protein
MPDPLWYFVHIPKTAGTTVRHYLHTSFAPHEVLFVYPAPIAQPDAHRASFEEVMAMPPAEIARYRVLYGHYLFRPEWLIHERVRALAFVRDPAARVVSWFHYQESLDPEGCTPRQRGYVAQIRGGIRFEELYRSAGGILELDNGIVRYLSGAGGDPVGSIGSAHLERAIRHVERHFDFIGHAAYFERSMAEIGRILGRPYRSQSRKNASPSGPAEDLLSQHSAAFLEELTSVDRAFVDWVEQRWFRG